MFRIIRDQIKENLIPFIADNNQEIMSIVMQRELMYSTYSYKSSSPFIKTFSYTVPTQLEQYLDLVDERDRKLLEQVISRVNAMLAFKRSKIEQYKDEPWMFSTNKTMKVRDYQHNTIKLMEKQNRILNASATRLGKTVMVLKYFQIKDIKKIVVFAPLTSLSASWKIKVEKWTGDKTFVLDHSTKEKNEKILQEWVDSEDGILISNYQKLDIIEQHLNNNIGIIVDESHKFRKNDKNRKSLNSRFKKMCKKFDKNLLVLLSATPTAKGSEEFFSQLKMLKPHTFKDWLMFLNRLFLYNITTFGKYDVLKVKEQRKQEFKDLLDLFCVQDKQDVLDYLPNKIFRRVEIDMPLDIRHHHDNVVNYMETWKDENTCLIDAQSTAVAIARLSSFLLDPKGFKNPKYDYFQKILNRHKGTPIVVFSRLKEPLDAWVEEFRGRGYKVDTYTGDTKNGIEVYKNFQSGKTDIIFCTYAAKEAIDLDASNVVVFLARDYLAIHNEQAFERIFPTTKERAKGNMIGYDLVYKNSIEEKIFEILTQKEKATFFVNNYKTLDDLMR